MLQLPSRLPLAPAAWAAVALTLLALLLAHSLTTLLASDHTPLQLLGYLGFAVSVFSPHIGILMAIAGIAALLLRRRSLAAACLLAATLGLSTVLWTLRPSLGAPSRALPPLRVLELNALFTNTDHDRIIALARAQSPDLLVFEEYTAPLDAALRSALDDLYPHVFSVVRPNGRGQAIYSKLPLTNPRELELAPGPWQGPPLTADLLWQGRVIQLIAVHLPSVPSRQHLVQNYRTVEALAQIAASSTRDLLLVGDCNFTPETRQQAMLLRAGLRDSALDAGFGRGVTHPMLGLPAWCEPGFPIDHVFAKGDLAFTSSTVLGDVGSDHRPLLVTLTPGPGRRAPPTIASAPEARSTPTP